MQTHAEKTEYRQTPNYADTIAFAKELAQASPAIEYRAFGHSGQGRELPLVIASETQTFTPEAARADGIGATLAGGYSEESLRRVREYPADRVGLGAKGLGYERLDQLTTEVLLGVR